LTKQQIPFVDRDGRIYALGRKAEQFAYAVNSTLRRPMADGTISREQEAIALMASIVHAIMGKLEQDALIYYCVPSNAINKQVNVQMHQKIVQMIIDGYKRSQVNIKANHISESRALAIASEKDNVISISLGAGMVNVGYYISKMPIFEFALVGSGDYIDIEAARQFGYDPDRPDKRSQETPTTICKRKEAIDLTKTIASMDRVDQAVAVAYQVLIENVVKGIIDGFVNNPDKAKVLEVPFVLAGGTAMPIGFGAYFEKVLRGMRLPFVVTEVIVHPRTLFAVAEGCLIAAEACE